MREGRNIMQLKEKKNGLKEEFVGIQREVEKEREENIRKINGNEDGNEHERKNEHVFHEIKIDRHTDIRTKKSTGGKRRKINFIFI